MLYDKGFEDDDLVVRISDMLVATADAADDGLDGAIGDVLRLLRERMGMDVVFVSEFVDGRRVFRNVVQPQQQPVLTEGEGEPLEETWCKRVVDGRLPQFIPDTARDASAQALLGSVPFPIGTHISTPIVLANGDVYGTLCCFSFEHNPRASVDDLTRLQMTARLAAQKLGRG